MIITPIKTRVLVPPQDDLLGVIREALPSLEERTILTITSKVVSIGEGRCVSKSEYPDKDALIRQEADRYLPRELAPQGWVMHTIKNNLFIPSAGIDESNANDYYVLWPRDPRASAERIWRWLRDTYKIRTVGVLITDSHTIPLRRGTLGISLAHWGFQPVKDYRGTNDLFGRAFKMTQADIADGLAAAAVVAMGEGQESTPIATITDIPFVQFLDEPTDTTGMLEIEEKEDLYYPLLSNVPWEKGNGDL